MASAVCWFDGFTAQDLGHRGVEVGSGRASSDKALQTLKNENIFQATV
jgi:hypothetical protein